MITPERLRVQAESYRQPSPITGGVDAATQPCLAAALALEQAATAMEAAEAALEAVERLAHHIDRPVNIELPAYNA